MKLVGQLTQKGQMTVAGKGHAEYTILVLDDARPLQLVVTCDSPPESEIDLLLWEYNPPAILGPLGPGPQSDPRVNGTEGQFDPASRSLADTELCLRLKGRIKQVGKRTYFEPNPAYQFATEYPHNRSFLVDFGDGVPRRVPIPRNPEFEEDLRGIVWKLIARFQVGKKAFETPWVALRDYRHATPEGRPVVAIIMRTLDSEVDTFKENALKFWAQHADIVRTEETLENALAFLRGGVDTAVIGPWGEVNIVAHGFFVAWNVALLNPASDLSNMVHHAEDHWVLAGELEDAIATKRLAPPSEAAIDPKSRVVIRGCVLGNDARLSQVIAGLFGSRCPVYVSKMLQGYSHDRASVGAFLREVAVYCYGTASASKAQPQPTSTAANHFVDKYDFASAAPRLKLLGRWTARITESNSWGTNSHIPVNKRRALSCEVDYPTNQPKALAWTKAQFGIAPSAERISASFYSEFTEDRSGLNTFEAERDAIDTVPKEGKGWRQPYLWGISRKSVDWSEVIVRGNSLVSFLYEAWTYLISFEHRADEPSDPDSWSKSKAAPIDLSNTRQFRRIG